MQRPIFDLTIDGKGPEQIARILEQDEVLTAKALYAKQSENHPDPKKRKKMPERPYHWIGQSVVGILERMEYTGCTCNFKTYSKSYKLKKRIPNAVEDMCIFPDTQEAIVSKAQWNRVQELRKTNAAPQKRNGKGYSPVCCSVPIAGTSCISPPARALTASKTTMYAPATKATVVLAPLTISVKMYSVK